MKFRSLLTFETIKYLKVCLYFTITWICLIFLFLAFFDSIKQNATELTALYASFPKELLDTFGKGIDSITSIYGYFGNQIMLYIVISGCIFTVFITSNSLASEIGNRNILFLLSKPISRLKIYSAKFIAIVISLLASNVVLLITTIIAIKILTKENNLDLNFFVLIYIALFILELFFLGLSELLGSKLSSGKVGAIGSLFVIFSYLLNILSGLSDKATELKYLSPNYYLDLASIAVNKALKPEAMLILILGLVFVSIGGYLFKRRDIN